MKSLFNRQSNVKTKFVLQEVSRGIETQEVPAFTSEIHRELNNLAKVIQADIEGNSRTETAPVGRISDEESRNNRGDISVESLATEDSFRIASYGTGTEITRKNTGMFTVKGLNDIQMNRDIVIKFANFLNSIESRFDSASSFGPSSNRISVREGLSRTDFLSDSVFVEWFPAQGDREQVIDYLNSRIT